MADRRVESLREMFRNIQLWRSFNEAEGYEILRCPITNVEWSIVDIEFLLSEGVSHLPARQRQAIMLCLVADMKESDAAVEMGVSPTNPVSMYANDGIRSLLVMIDAGVFPQMRVDWAAA